MPVLDVQRELSGQWPCLGRIRLGGPKGEKRPGRDLAYFDLRDVPELVAILGEHPTEIPVYLPFDDPNRVLVAFHENYVSGGLACMGDGERIFYRRDEAMEAVIRQGAVQIPFGEYTKGEVVPCPGLAHSHPWCTGCKPRMRLRVMVAGVYRLGYYEVISSSVINLRTITERLLALQETAGRLTRIPLWLVRQKRILSVPSGDGKRIQVEKYLLDLVVDVAAAKQQVAAFLPHEALALPEPDEEEEIASGQEVEQVVEGRLLNHQQQPAPQQPVPQPQSKPPESPWHKRTALINRIRLEVDRYRAPQAAINALKKLEREGSVNWDMGDDEILGIVKAHAEQREERG